MQLQNMLCGVIGVCKSAKANAHAERDFHYHSTIPASQRATATNVPFLSQAAPLRQINKSSK
jgi:hypothetical protein